jgi:hypothetical protein
VQFAFLAQVRVGGLEHGLQNAPPRVYEPNKKMVPILIKKKVRQKKCKNNLPIVDLNQCEVRFYSYLSLLFLGRVRMLLEFRMNKV